MITILNKRNAISHSCVFPVMTDTETSLGSISVLLLTAHSEIHTPMRKQKYSALLYLVGVTLFSMCPVIADAAASQWSVTTTGNNAVAPASMPKWSA